MAKKSIRLAHVKASLHEGKSSFVWIGSTNKIKQIFLEEPGQVEALGSWLLAIAKEMKKNCK